MPYPGCCRRRKCGCTDGDPPDQVSMTLAGVAAIAGRSNRWNDLNDTFILDRVPGTCAYSYCFPVDENNDSVDDAMFIVYFSFGSQFWAGYSAGVCYATTVECPSLCEGACNTDTCGTPNFYEERYPATTQPCALDGYLVPYFSAFFQADLTSATCEISAV